MELQHKLGGHCNETFVQVNGFCPLRGGGGRHLANKVVKFETKISLRKLWVVYIILENERQKEICFYLFFEYKQRSE